MGNSKKFKQILKNFLENLKKPTIIVAVGVFHVSMENFLKVINASYSLFTLMMSINNFK